MSPRSRRCEVPLAPGLSLSHSTALHGERGVGFARTAMLQQSLSVVSFAPSCCPPCEGSEQQVCPPRAPRGRARFAQVAEQLVQWKESKPILLAANLMLRHLFYFPSLLNGKDPCSPPPAFSLKYRRVAMVMGKCPNNPSPGGHPF